MEDHTAPLGAKKMSDMRDLSDVEKSSVPHEVRVTFTADEFVVVCRQLVAIGQRDPMRGTARDAFGKLVRAAQAGDPALTTTPTAPLGER